MCRRLAEDDKVFAVLGVFIDFTGQGQLCLTKQHKVIHIGHELDQPWIDFSGIRFPHCDFRKARLPVSYRYERVSG